MPSFTALVVALGRGLANDQLADRLLPAPFAQAQRALRRAIERAPWLGPGANLLTGGLIEHMRWRTAAIDRCVEGAVAAGITQVVILGAGLDARGYRISALRDAVVFEIDHPSTQAYKRSKAAALKAAAKAVHFIAVDFERDALAAKLEMAGHRDQIPTLWIWEGVTPYLERAAIRSSLAQIAVRSARGSLLAMTYFPPELTRLPLSPRLIHAGFRLLGEPLRGLLSQGEAADEVARAGFRALSDRSCNDEPAPGKGRLFSAWVTERLIVAERRA